MEKRMIIAIVISIVILYVYNEMFLKKYTPPKPLTQHKVVKKKLEKKIPVTKKINIKEEEIKNYSWK